MGGQSRGSVSPRPTDTAIKAMERNYHTYAFSAPLNMWVKAVYESSKVGQQDVESYIAKLKA